MSGLRPYQVEAIEAVRCAAERAVGVALPTGTGKTRLAVELVEALRAECPRAVFLVPSVELMLQAGAAFGCDNLAGGGRVADWSNPLTVSTVQTAANQLARIEAARPELLLVDEAHHAVSDTYRRVLESIPWRRVVHLSATMFRADGQALSSVCDRVVYERDLHWAIEQGYLTRYELRRPKDAHRLPRTSETILVTRADGTAKEISRTSYDHTARNRMVAELTHRLAKQYERRCGIMFCNTVGHAVKMAAELGEGWGWCSADHRDDLRRFQAGELQGIVSVQLILEGFDHPPADYLVVNGNIRGDSTGAIRWIQLLGRVLRLADGKNLAVAVDLSVNGLPDIDYRSDLEGTPDEMTKAEAEIELSASMTVLERLEHPMLVRLEDLVEGLRLVNDRTARLQRELGTRLKLRESGMGDYVVVNAPGCRLSHATTGWVVQVSGKRHLCDNMDQVESFIAQHKQHFRGSNERAATDRQVARMVKWGMKRETAEMMSSAQASAYMQEHIARSEGEAATVKQRRFLEWKLGRNHVPARLGKREAARMIAQAMRGAKR